LSCGRACARVGLAELSRTPFFPPVAETLLRAVPRSLRESEVNTLGEVERADPAAARAGMEEHMDYELRPIRQVFPERDHAR
jgi:hypothetical protein